MIVGKEFRLPGGDPFPVQLGEFGLPFFDQLQGLPAAPLGSSEHPFRVRSLSGLWVGNESHRDGDCSVLHSLHHPGWILLPFVAHFGSGLLDGVLGHAVCDEPAAEFFDSTVIGAQGFELGQVLA